MLDAMKTLLRDRRFCVLATVSGEKPHCSLMSYAFDEESMTLLMATGKGTRKRTNMSSNPSVCLLVDDRDEEGGGARRARALTVNGAFEKISERAGAAAARQALLARHPGLKAFADDPETELFRVRIGSMQLLDGLTDASFVDLGGQSPRPD